MSSESASPPVTIEANRATLLAYREQSSSGVMPAAARTSSTTACCATCNEYARPVTERTDLNGKAALGARNDGPCDEGDCSHMADDLTVTREGDTLVIRIPITSPTPSSRTSTSGTMRERAIRDNEQWGEWSDGLALVLRSLEGTGSDLGLLA